MSDEEKKKANLLLSDAILAIIIPVAGYYVAYQYELGRAGYFGISGSLVEVGLTNVLQVIVYLFGSSGFFMGNPIGYNGSRRFWSHARYRALSPCWAY